MHCARASSSRWPVASTDIAITTSSWRRDHCRSICWNRRWKRSSWARPKVNGTAVQARRLTAVGLRNGGLHAYAKSVGGRSRVGVECSGSCAEYQSPGDSGGHVATAAAAIAVSGGYVAAAAADYCGESQSSGLLTATRPDYSFRVSLGA